MSKNHITFQVENTKKNFKTQIGRISHSFTGRRISRYSGLKTLHKYILRSGVHADLDMLFPTTRENASKFTNAQIIENSLMANLCGENRMSRMENFSDDPLVRHLLQLPCRLSDSSIKARLESLGEKGGRKLQAYSLKKSGGFLAAQEIKRTVVDLDSTVELVYGNQEGAAKGYNPGRKSNKCYHPQLAFCSTSKLVLNSWFRAGDVYTSNGVGQFISETAAALPKGSRIWLRADSGFFSNEFMSAAEDQGYKYLVKVKLKGLRKLLEAQRWTVNGRDENIKTCRFSYKAKSWPHKRKMLAVRIQINKGKGSMGEDIIEYKYFCYCTDLEVSAVGAHELYKKRGECENWIEQVKNHLRGCKTLTDNFWVNDLLWTISVLAYNISVGMRYCSGKKYWRQEHATFMRWFINVPGMVVSSGRRTILRIYENLYERQDWEYLDKLWSG